MKYEKPNQCYLFTNQMLAEKKQSKKPWEFSASLLNGSFFHQGQSQKHNWSHKITSDRPRDRLMCKQIKTEGDGHRHDVHRQILTTSDPSQLICQVYNFVSPQSCLSVSQNIKCQKMETLALERTAGAEKKHVCWPWENLGAVGDECLTSLPTYHVSMCMCTFVSRPLNVVQYVAELTWPQPGGKEPETDQGMWSARRRRDGEVDTQSKTDRGKGKLTGTMQHKHRRLFQKHFWFSV